MNTPHPHTLGCLYTEHCIQCSMWIYYKYILHASRLIYLLKQCSYAHHANSLL